MFFTLLIVLLVVIGLLAVLSIALDSLWSPLELVSSYLMPYFLPAEDQPLTKKFGSWAGMYSFPSDFVILLRYWFASFFLMDSLNHNEYVFCYISALSHISSPYLDNYLSDNI